MPPLSKKVVDTLSDPAIFPNLKALFCDIKPFSLRPPFEMDYRGYYDRHGTTLTVFAPISCASVVDVLQSLVRCYQRPVRQRSRRTVMPKMFRQAPTVPTVHFSRLRVSRVRFQPGGALLEDVTHRRVSKLTPIVDRGSLTVDLGNQPIDNMANGLAEAMESYLRMGDARPNEEFWRLSPWRVSALCHSSKVPACMTAVSTWFFARTYRLKSLVTLPAFR